MTKFEFSRRLDPDDASCAIVQIRMPVSADDLERVDFATFTGSEAVSRFLGMVFGTASGICRGAGLPDVADLLTQVLGVVSDGVVPLPSRANDSRPN